jgi:hypothetical protein
MIRRPDLPPDVLCAFEAHGTESMRSFLYWQGGHQGIGMARDTAWPLGELRVTRGQVEDWLRWKDAVNARWMKAAAIAAVIGAVAAIVAAAR